MRLVKDGLRIEERNIVHLLAKAMEMNYCDTLVNIGDNDGKKAIYFAKGILLRILYNASQYRNKQDKKGRVPLHYLAEKQCIEEIEIIKELASERKSI